MGFQPAVRCVVLIDDPSMIMRGILL